MDFFVAASVFGIGCQLLETRMLNRFFQMKSVVFLSTYNQQHYLNATECAVVVILKGPKQWRIPPHWYLDFFVKLKLIKNFINEILLQCFNNNNNKNNNNKQVH